MNGYAAIVPHSGFGPFSLGGNGCIDADMVHIDAERVRRYYDENTRLFLSLGQGTEGTIHRAIWGEGVVDRTQAMAYADRLVQEQIELLKPAGLDLHIVDLGCGVCASLCRLARSLEIRGTGVTLSAKQVALAAERIQTEGLGDRLRCVQADFCELPTDLPSADLAFGIESFVHAPDVQAYFRECSRLVKPKGKLVVCDDFKAHTDVEQQESAKKWLERFRQGWLAGNVLSLEEADAIAQEHGFVRESVRDLTPFLELGRPRDIAIAALMRTLGWLPGMGNYFSMLRGGHALQVGLQRGWLSHLFVVWRRV